MMISNKKSLMSKVLRSFMFFSTRANIKSLSPAISLLALMLLTMPAMQQPAWGNETASVDKVPSETASVDKVPNETASVDKVPSETASVDKVPSENAPVAKTEGENTPDTLSPESEALKKLLTQPTSAQIEKGKSLFSLSCAICHGEKGDGKGPGAGTFNPRDFTTAPSVDYKNGDTPLGLLKTLNKGVAGTVMAPFPSIKLEDQLAIIHYIRTLTPQKPVDDEAAISKFLSSLAPEKKAEGKTLSIAYALAKSAKAPRQAYNLDFVKEGKGAEVYKKNCMECHGSNGEGGIAIKNISAAPFYRLKTEALFGHDGYWTQDELALCKLVTEGIAGSFMPAAGTLSKTEVKELYNYLREQVELAKEARN